MDELLGPDIMDIGGSLGDQSFDLQAMASSDGAADASGVPGATAPYMSDLLSLPVFKMESLGFGEVDNGPRYLLMAPTSPLCKLADISLTYLNKSQAYELTLEALGRPDDYRSGLIRTSLRMSFFFFSDIILRNQEREHWGAWSLEHPGERVIEVESGFMVENITHDVSQPNLVMFDWYASKGGSIMLKVNCLSSEFAPKRHGGEKGIVLRLEIDAYHQYTEHDCFELFHASNCHIKVFKDKGADRKHKQELQKACSLPPDEQANLKPSFTVTVFQDFCTEVCGAPKQLPPGSISIENVSITSPTISLPAVSSTSGSAPFLPSPAVIKLENLGGPAGPDSVDSGTGSSIEVFSPAVGQAPPVAQASWDGPMPGPLRVDSTVQQTQEWLMANGFGMHQVIFNNFSGVDVLKLQREDMKEILGEAEGIRLNNALQTRSIRPLQVFYVLQPNDVYYRGVYLYNCSVTELQNVLARHCNLLPGQIASIHWFTGALVPVVVDREVLMNIPTESTVRLEKKLRSTDAVSGLEEYDLQLFSTP